MSESPDRVAVARRTLPGSRALWLLAGVAGILAAFALGRWSPSSDPADTVCALRRVAGVTCPGCGMGRAGAALFRGDWAAAFAFHPLIVWVVVQVVAAWAMWGLVAWGRIRPPASSWFARLVVVNLALFVGVWLVRVVS